MKIMVSEEVCHEFKEHIATPLLSYYVRQLHVYYLEHRVQLGKELLKAWGRLCSEAVRQQRSRGKESVGYILCSMLRTSIHTGSGIDRLDAYDGTWYFDPQECCASYDASWIYKPWKQYVQDMLTRRQEYKGAISTVYIERLALGETSYFHRYVHHLFRSVLPELLEQEAFVQLQLSDPFEIRVGEYMDSSEGIYHRAASQLENKAVRRWLERRKELDYVYRTIPPADCSQGDFAELDFRYSVLQKVHFDNSKLEKGVWLGTRFEGCSMREANAQRCFLYDAVFKDCDLREADFSGAMGNQYTWDEQEKMYYGMEGVDFGGSDLTGANFRGAMLEGARFDGAVLKETDFTGASLKDAVFAREAWGQTAWSERQLAEIRWV